MSLRSSSDLPPQTPLSWLESRAYSKHSTCDGHLEQTFLAKEIASNALPVLPIGKKSSGLVSLQSANSRQSLCRS